ncbi:IS1595 family transposase [Mucilaginibacter sp. R-33]|uniref:IS1595 family transposase n=1 Tax=Mucilaginibacter sp. R-33 TaxID=3416711 RepID=UPI003CEB1E47
MEIEQPKLGKALPFRTINDIAIHFKEKDTCIEYLTLLRWSGKVKCAHCNHDKVYELKGAYKGYKCAKCRKKFNATKNTIFENSPIELSKWFMAIFILSTHRKGISSVQVARNIGVTQKTAWFMMQRVRYAFKMNSFNEPFKLGKSKFDEKGKEIKTVVEADETYIGGKPGNMHKHKQEAIEKRGTQNKIGVIGAIERGGKVKLSVIDNTDHANVIPFLVKSVHQGTKLMTDEHVSYNTMNRVFEHQTIKHMLKEYVRGEVHTNTIENFWSLLKRGVYGTYHYISPKHVAQYLEEFAFRFNSRELTEAQRFDNLISLSNYKITYKVLTANHGSKETQTS